MDIFVQRYGRRGIWCDTPLLEAECDELLRFPLSHPGAEPVHIRGERYVAANYRILKGQVVSVTYRKLER